MCLAALTSGHSQSLQQTVTRTAQQAADRQLMLGALQTLSVEHREVLRECYYRGASVAEAAETLSVPADAVKSRTHYALRVLRTALAPEHDPPASERSAAGAAAHEKMNQEMEV